MLSSITPLGQRGRGLSWARTMVAFWIGSMTGSGLVFGLLGLFGNLTGLSDLPGQVLVLVLGVAGLLDYLRVTPPGPARQVNEDWLTRFRDWVTGVGFGFQLGVGFATYVPVFAVWGLYASAVLLGLPGSLFLGLGFGVGRGLLLFATRHVEEPADLARLMSRFAHYERVAVPALLISYVVLIPGVVADVI